MKQVNLNVAGITCSGCVDSITRVLKAIDGVADARVNVQNGSVFVEFDETKTDADALVAAVEDAGYEAHVS